MAESEFGGWAKITCSDAAELARIVPLFSRRTLEERVRMLLVLFASQSRDGTVSIGYRTLAERAHVSEYKAQRFMSMLKDEGVLVDVREVKNRGGEYTVRAFDWVLHGAAEKCSTPAAENAGKVQHPRCKKPAKTAAHQSSTELSEGAAVGRLAPAAASHETDDDDYSGIMARLNRMREERLGGDSIDGN